VHDSNTAQIILIKILHWLSGDSIFNLKKNSWVTKRAMERRMPNIPFRDRIRHTEIPKGTGVTNVLTLELAGDRRNQQEMDEAFLQE